MDRSARAVSNLPTFTLTGGTLTVDGTNAPDLILVGVAKPAGSIRVIVNGIPKVFTGVESLDIEGEVCVVSGKPTNDILPLYVLVSREFVVTESGWGKFMKLLLVIMVSPLMMLLPSSSGKLVPAVGSENRGDNPGSTFRVLPQRNPPGQPMAVATTPSENADLCPASQG